MTDSDSLPACYSIDNSLLTSNTPLSTYFLKGTVVNLYYRTPVTNTALQASQVLQQNASWVLSAGLWRNAPVPVIQPSIVQNFYTNGPNPTTLVYPATVYNDMTNYMGLYMNYAASGFGNTAIKAQLQATNAILINDITKITGN